MKFNAFKLSNEDYVLIENGEPKEDLHTIYHYTSIIEMVNERQAYLGGEYVCMTELSQELQLKYRFAIYKEKYGITKSYTQALNKAKRDEVETGFISFIGSMNMELPENYDDIVQYIFEYIIKLPKENWGEEDIIFGFQHWIESK
jgi:hypothetical protein